MKIDLATLAQRVGSRYPAPFDAPCRGRFRTPLGDAAGLTQFGVNLLRLAPGCWSSQRHWHTEEDEFVYVLSGEVVMVTDAGEQLLSPGDCAAFKASQADGHHLQNRSNSDAVVLEIGARSDNDGVHYSDIDLALAPAAERYSHKDGTPY